MTRAWFKLKNPHYMTVHYKDPTNKKNGIVDVTVTDIDLINRTIKDIESTPIDGPMMIKMDGSRTIQVTLTFSNEEPSKSKETDVITFYNGMIKTPSTGFHDPQLDVIKKLYSDILKAANIKVVRKTK